MTRTRLVVHALLAALVVSAGCTPSAVDGTPTLPNAAPGASIAPQPALTPAEPPPKGRLPADTRPGHYTLSLDIVPSAATFTGVVDVEVVLTGARDVLWMHGKSLTVKRVTVTPKGAAALGAEWKVMNDDGVAAVSVPGLKLLPGDYTVHLEYEAPFREHDKGLYKVKVGSESYAFTQFEAIDARAAFPCFDEPSFKTPFDVTLTVLPGHKAISNTRDVESKEENGRSRVKFATTEPLPTYLIAFAAGPLDVLTPAPIPPNSVRKRPLPLRGVAVKGRHTQMAYALEHTGPILAVLEEYFGIEYPYDKLDIIAVPDKSGAMENPGAVTFREFLVLLDPKKAPVYQRRAYAGVMAHELAHMWFGDLVTMPWWDDIWLNEAFATWMGNRAATVWRPDTQADIRLLDGVGEAMGTDALVSARRIRQPIESTHDIENAFDSITYQKGGGVLSMFERWLGKETFRKGIQSYLAAHRHGSATSADLLTQLGKASGKDVTTPFRTFLDQPGVPFVEAKVTCGGGGDPQAKDSKASISFKQSRYFPLGSTGDAKQKWQIPICTRYQVGKDVKEVCTLLTEPEGRVELEGCPAWVFPNSDGAGYFSFSLAEGDLAKLAKEGVPKLSTRERMAYGNSLRAAFGRATVKAGDVLDALAPLATDPHPTVADEPMGTIWAAWDWLGPSTRAKVEKYGQALYKPPFQALGFSSKTKEEDPDKAALRARLLGFLIGMHDSGVRSEGVKRGRAYLGIGGDGALHPEAVDPELAGPCVVAAVQDGEPAVFDAALALLVASEDEVVRGRLLGGLGAATKPELAARARDLALDPRVRQGEVLSTLWQQFGNPLTRDATWQWLKDHLDAVSARIAPERAAGLVNLATVYCDKAHADEVESLFRPRADKLKGGPRQLDSAVETIRLCAARREVQEPHLRAFFEKRR